MLAARALVTRSTTKEKCQMRLFLMIVWGVAGLFSCIGALRAMLSNDSDKAEEHLATIAYAIAPLAAAFAVEQIVIHFQAWNPYR